jgi:hypothetical protein
MERKFKNIIRKAAQSKESDARGSGKNSIDSLPLFTNKGKFKTENLIERGSSPFLFL